MITVREKGPFEPALGRGAAITSLLLQKVDGGWKVVEAKSPPGWILQENGRVDDGVAYPGGPSAALGERRYGYQRGGFGLDTLVGISSQPAGGDSSLEESLDNMVTKETYHIENRPGADVLVYRKTVNGETVGRAETAYAPGKVAIEGGYIQRGEPLWIKPFG